MKRILAVIMALTLCLTMLPAAVLAEEDMPVADVGSAEDTMSEATPDEGSPTPATGVYFSLKDNAPDGECIEEANQAGESGPRGYWNIPYDAEHSTFFYYNPSVPVLKLTDESVQGVSIEPIVAGLWKIQLNGRGGNFVLDLAISETGKSTLCFGFVEISYAEGIYSTAENGFPSGDWTGTSKNEDGRDGYWNYSYASGEETVFYYYNKHEDNVTMPLPCMNCRFEKVTNHFWKATICTPAGYGDFDSQFVFAADRGFHITFRDTNTTDGFYLDAELNAPKGDRVEVDHWGYNSGAAMWSAWYETFPYVPGEEFSFYYYNAAGTQASDFHLDLPDNRLETNNVSCRIDPVGTEGKFWKVTMTIPEIIPQFIVHFVFQDSTRYDLRFLASTLETGVYDVGSTGDPKNALEIREYVGEQQDIPVYGPVTYTPGQQFWFYYYDENATENAHFTLADNNSNQECITGNSISTSISYASEDHRFAAISMTIPNRMDPFTLDFLTRSGNILVEFESTTGNQQPTYQQGLYYKPLRGVNDGQPYVDENDPYLSDPIVFSPYVDRCDIATYYYNGQSFTPVEVGFSDTLAVDVVTYAERPGWYVFAAYDYGNGEIYYDDNYTQTSHILSIETQIPDYAFYAEDTVSEESYRMYTLSSPNTSMNEDFKDYKYVKELYFLPSGAGYDLREKDLQVEVLQRKYLKNGNEIDSVPYPDTEYAYILDMAPDGRSLLVTVFTNDSDVLFKLNIWEKTLSGNREQFLYGNYVNLLTPDDTETIVFHMNGQGDYASAKFLPKHIFDELDALDLGVTVEQENFPGSVGLDKEEVKDIVSSDKAVTFFMAANAATEAEKQLIAAALAAGETTVDVVELKLYYGRDAKHHLGGPATIKYYADLPTNTEVKVYYLRDDGTLEEMQAIYKNGGIHFNSSHFSKFVMTKVTPSAPPSDKETSGSDNPSSRPSTSVKPTKPQTPAAPVFTDVPENYWAKSAIDWAASKGYVTGTTDTTYAPRESVSRQQIWMMLSRVSCENAADMAAAKAWAVANGISDGTNPGTAVTRQQLVTLLYRYAVLMGYDVSVGENTNILSYDDVFSVSEYAIPAFQWACGAGVINGTTDSTLSPLGTATRAQFAVMLQRFCEKVVK